MDIFREMENVKTNSDGKPIEGYEIVITDCGIYKPEEKISHHHHHHKDKKDKDNKKSSKTEKIKEEELKEQEIEKPKEVIIKKPIVYININRLK